MRIKMNRTIKFRGKSADNGKWITGYYYHECGNTYIVEDRQSLSETSRNVPYVVIPETVGQFTGLFDNNGKEIYEGDILFMGNDEYENIYNKVGIKDGCFGYIGEYSGELLPFCNYNVTEEVVGNIYDNPDLIKEE